MKTIIHLMLLLALTLPAMAARDRVITGMDLEIGAINVDEWYAAKKDQWPLNYGTTISQEGVRTLVHGPEARIKGSQNATTILASLQKVVAAEECLRNQVNSTTKREST